MLWLDVARVIAIVSISLNHAVNRTYENYHNQAGEFVELSLLHNLFKAGVTFFSHLGVPLFLMISGALLMRKKMEDEHDVARFYRHNLLPMVITAEIWYAIMYWFILLVQPGQTSLADHGFLDNLLGMIRTMLFTSQVTLASMWYMPMIICLYTVLPLLSMAIQRMKSRRVLLLPLGILLMGSMLVPNGRDFLTLVGFDFELSFALNPSFIFSYYFLYLLAGYFISTGKLEKLPTWAVALGAAGSFALLSSYQCFAYSRPQDYQVGYGHVGTLICAGLLFELLRRKGELLSPLKGIIGYLSRISFGIYFVHILIMCSLRWYLDLRFLTRPGMLIFLEVVSVGGSIAIIWLASKWPWAKKHLFMIKD